MGLSAQNVQVIYCTKKAVLAARIVGITSVSKIYGSRNENYGFYKIHCGMPVGFYHLAHPKTAYVVMGVVGG